MYKPQFDVGKAKNWAKKVHEREQIGAIQKDSAQDVCNQHESWLQPVNRTRSEIQLTRSQIILG
jgi:hypothetical protein